MTEAIGEYERDKGIELAFAANAAKNRIKQWKANEASGIRIESWGGFQHTPQERAENTLAYQREGLNRRLNETQVNEWVGINETFDALNEMVGHLIGRDVPGSDTLFTDKPPRDIAA